MVDYNPNFSFDIVVDPNGFFDPITKDAVLSLSVETFGSSGAITRALLIEGLTLLNGDSYALRAWIQKNKAGGKNNIQAFSAVERSEKQQLFVMAVSNLALSRLEQNNFSFSLTQKPAGENAAQTLYGAANTFLWRAQDCIAQITKEPTVSFSTL